MDTFSSHLSVIGVSPRNTYYADSQNIEYALDTVLAEQKCVYVLVPDVPDIQNYLAFGYGAAQAKKKASRQSHQLKQSIREVCERKGYFCADIHAPTAQVRVIDWGRDIEPRPLYQAQRAEMQALYLRDDAFRADIREATTNVLHSRLKQLSLNVEAQNKLKANWTHALDIAINYILSEFAFLKAAPRLMGVDQVDYIYHRPWPIYEDFLNRKYDCERPTGLGFRILERQELKVI